MHAALHFAQQSLGGVLHAYGSPILPALIVLVLVLQKVTPVDRDEPFLSRGLIEDFVWFNISLISTVTAYRFLQQEMALFCRHLYGAHGPSFVAAWPRPVVLVLAALAFDFARWLGHLAQHKIPVLWPFHAVHHSQTRLNVFTDDRCHPIEALVMALMRVPVILLFGLQPQDIWILFIADPLNRLNHCNLKFDYGPLRYILVSPQAHRAHHSRHAEHRECNFGSVLSIWDHLFGTALPDHHVYPRTGLSVEHPEGKGFSAREPILGGVLRRLTEPFAAAAAAALSRPLSARPVGER